MIFLLLILLFLIILGWYTYSKTLGRNALALDYMTPSTTLSIKGVFVVLIFLSHFLSYVDVSEFYDVSARSVCSFLGQMIVVPFLFYSGYGVYEAIKAKGIDYVRGFPKKRILKVLLHFDFAVILFLILQYCLGNNFETTKILLSFLAWDSIGNSNWFIFAIIMTYIFTYISFSLKLRHFWPIFAVSAFTCVYIVLLYFTKKSEPWWYDTILCFPVGMLYSYYKDQIECKVMEKRCRFILFCVVLLGVFFVCRSEILGFTSITQHFAAVSFALILPCFSRMIIFDSKILKWFGEQVFGIYILQRIPMLFFKEMGLANNLYIYFLLCFVFTLLLAVGFKKITDSFDRKFLS